MPGIAAMGERTKSMPRLVISEIRVRQWVKNLLVFLPTLLAYRFLDPAPVLNSTLAFLSFSFGASAVYVLNDLLDLEADRDHPEKRNRPFASGRLSLRVGYALIPLLLLASLALAYPLPRRFLLALAAYFAVTSLYSFFLKQIALVDILLLASLYTLRIMAGSAATGIVVSEWLLAFSMFLFLSLAAVKRYVELLRLRQRINDENSEGPARVKRRGYFAADLELIVQMGLASGYIAVLVLALYISSDTVTQLYGHPRVLWFVCPLLLYWVSRIWLLAHRGVLQEDPLSFAVNDRITWVVAGASASVLLVASALFES
jgi:4-hydroxybenzoate polyprenyltransferase